MASVSASSRPAVRPRASVRVLGGFIAVLAVLALAAWFAVYPLDKRLAALALGVYGALVLARPNVWLVLLPALWPVVDLAPWGGHIHFTESDGLALTTLAALGLRELFAPPAPTLPGRAPAKLRLAALLLFGLLALSVVVSGLRGGLPLPPADAAALVGYNTPVNALRIGKGFVLAFMLIPFLHLAIRRDGEAALDRFALGLGLGLLTCSIAALWERLAFPGLTNFASDYRTTALFWEMHVGGAALDAWLLMSFPFALLALRRIHNPLLKALLLVAVALGVYALFTTFSRIVYGGLLVSLAVLGLASWTGRKPTLAQQPEEARHLHPASLAAVGAALLVGAGLTFPEGGFRALLAFIATALLAWPAGVYLAGNGAARFVLGVLGGLVLTAACAGVMLALPKGVYGAFAALWLLGAALLLVLKRSGAKLSGVLVTALLVGLAGTTVLISAYWNSQGRFTGSAVGALLLVALLARQAIGRTPLWQPRAADVQGVVMTLALTGMVVTTLGGYYMGSRLSNTRSDVGTRFEHMERGLSLMHGTADNLIGIGLGRFPEAYYWQIADPATPGALALVPGASGRGMQVSGARQGRLIDEVVLLTQRLPMDTVTPLQVRLKAKAAVDTKLDVQVCRKHMLYARPCADASFVLKAGAGWQAFSAELKNPEMLTTQAVPQITTLTVGTINPAPIDVDDIELLDAQGKPVIGNGDFERGGDLWFFSSDHDHLPWHAKNMLVHVLIEQGWLGVVALSALFLAGVARLARAPTRLQTHAPTLLAALVGVGAVGLVDSLLDMPRITVFMLLLGWLALNLRRPPAH